MQARRISAAIAAATGGVALALLLSVSPAQARETAVFGGVTPTVEVVAPTATTVEASAPAATAATVSTTVAVTQVSYVIPDPAGLVVTQAFAMIPEGSYFGGYVSVYQTHFVGLDDTTVTFGSNFLDAFRLDGDGFTTLVVG